MLSRLSISNYALIENLQFCPGPGLSIITGETGAGKSVMMGALALLKGERADIRVIADKEKKSVVEATFVDIPAETAEKILEFDSEWDGNELIIRREITPSGRSRAFINDSPVTLNILSEITRDLLDIHSQNSNSLLSTLKTQLSLIDKFANTEGLLANYQKDFQSYVELRLKIKDIKTKAEIAKSKQDILEFKVHRLDKLKPKKGELKEIEQQYDTLSNAEELREKIVKTVNLLAGGEQGGAIGQIEESEKILSAISIAMWGEGAEGLTSRLNECIIELKDISDTIERFAREVEYNPARIENLSKRMNEYYSALREFKASSDEELETIHNTLKEELGVIRDGGEVTEDLEKEARELAVKLKKEASEITTLRTAAASEIESIIETESKRLGLENLRFKIMLLPVKLGKFGGESADFRASFNKNQTPVSIGEIASGGEIARLMLAIKKVYASRMAMPTIIFDEIDTGVSGIIADKMGEMMQQMGRETQIITITHLPQVAAKGERHFKVFKQDKENKTISDVMLLNEEQREKEIASMLSGRNLNEAALINARSLLENS